MSVLVLTVAGTTRLGADGEGLVVLGRWQVPELCLTKRVTGGLCPSCNLGRSVVLAVQGKTAASRERHGGGILIVGWLVLHAAIRVWGSLKPLPHSFWWLDLGLTAASLLALMVAVLVVSPFVL